MRWARVVVVAGPAVVLAGLGLTHPQDLTTTSAPWWTTLHVLLLPLFPLLAVSLWLLLRGVPGLVAWAARIAAYGYAAFYTALDVLAGIGAGELTQLNAERGLQTDAVEVDRLFAVGNDLGEIGVWCFGVACAATALVVGGWVGRRALPGAVVLVAAAVVFVAGGCAYLLAVGRWNDACPRRGAWAAGRGPTRSAAARHPGDWGTRTVP
jgi:hypothetical protein